MDIEPYEVRSPAELIQEVSERVRLKRGTAWAVLVHDPSRRQEVRAIAGLPCGSLVNDDEEARGVIEAICEHWGGRGWHSPCDLKVVTVIVREGLCVWTRVEWTWALAWRYASTGLSGGDTITVTEHGWYDFMTKHADHQPSLVEA
jgi:hypothetical protein